MAELITPPPSVIDYRFDAPRSVHISNSGIVNTTARTGGWWRGTMQFAETRGDEPNALLALARGDVANVGVLVDLPEGNPIPTGDPTWYDVGGLTTSQIIELQTGHGAVAGDLVSIQQAILPPGYVTARRITSITTDTDGNILAYLDAAFPEEYFAISPGTQVQYCLNRPHVRAVFTDPPQRVRKDDSVTMNAASVAWVEDTGGVTLALRSVSQVSVSSRALLSRQGEVVTDSNDQPITP